MTRSKVYPTPSKQDFYKSCVKDIDDEVDDEITSDDEIVCPYCGEAFSNGEYGDYSDSYCEDVFCQECGKTFEVTADMTITYTTKRKE